MASRLTKLPAQMRSRPGFWRRQPTSWHHSWLPSTGHLFNRPQSRMSGRRRTLSPSSRSETTPQLSTIALFRWHRSLRSWWNTPSARKWCDISTSMMFFTILNMASGKDVRARHSSYLVPTTSWRHSIWTFRRMPHCWTFQKQLTGWHTNIYWRSWKQSEW